MIRTVEELKKYLNELIEEYKDINSDEENTNA